MRSFLFVVLMLLGNPLFAQNTLDQFKKAVEDEEFVEALRYTPEIVNQYRKDNVILMLAADVYMEMELPDSAVSVLALAIEYVLIMPKF